MSYEDRILSCQECGDSFTFSILPFGKTHVGFQRRVQQRIRSRPT
jgi:hypothetical protein